MQLRELGVEAAVVAWEGKKGEVPRTAEIRVRIRTDGELDRELASVALVVGKYVHSYNLDVPRLEVLISGVDEAPRRQIIDAGRARLLYAERLSLLDFLTTMRAPAP
jgi:hypothetical protein